MLKLEGVTKRFDGFTAIQDVCLEVDKGKINGLIGPNGAGKTTLFNVITAIYKPTEGRILYNDLEITKLLPHKITALGMSRTFQNIRLFQNMTVTENIHVAQNLRINNPLLWLFQGSRSSESIRLHEQVESVLSFLGIWEYRDRMASQLPYGLQRRVEIARALATGADILLLDEPAAGMNEAESDDLKETIKKVKSELGKTVFIIDHDMSVIMGCCDTVAVLNYGKLITRGTPKEVQNNPEVIKAYLGVEDDDNVASA